MNANLLLGFGPATLLLLAAVVFVAGCLNGTTGLGFAVLTGVALAILLDARTAVILLAGITPLVMLMPVWRYRAEIPRARRLVPLFLATPPGILIGTWLLVTLPVPWIALGLGVVTLISVLASFRRGALKLPPAWEPVATPLMGLVAGASNGAVGVSGPMLGVYLLSLGIDHALFAFTVAAMFASMGLLRLGTLLWAGELGPATAAISLALCVPAIAGVRTGFWLQRRVDQTALNRIMLVVLLVGSLQIIWRGLTGLGLVPH